MPVRAATTLAAARGRAPDWTRWRRASTAKPTSLSCGAGGGGADHEDDLALDVAAEAPRQLAERAAGDLLVHLRELAADGGLAVGGERGQRRQRLADPARGLEGDDGLGRAQHPLHLAGPARQEALEAPAVGRQPGGDQRHRHDRGAGQDRRPRGRVRCSGGSACSRGRRSPACRRRRRGRRRRRARSAAPARSPARFRCPRGWRPAAAPAGSRACRAASRCGGCPRRRCSRR